MIRRRQRHSIISTVLGLVFLTACRSTVAPPTELQSIQTANDAYLAYARGDCRTALELSDPHSLEPWPFNEIRHSMLLLHGFCLEIEGKTDDAKEIYRRVLVETPNSFAASDARERLRSLKRWEDDPEYARWAKDAMQRRASGETTDSGRNPTDRTPAEYPPLARATGVEGHVVIEFGVSRNGETIDPIVVESKPPFIFDGASLRAVRRWQYARGASNDASRRQLIRIVFRNENYPNYSAPDSRATSPEP